MIIRMRTTLVIDDELLREAKKRAAALNLTVSEVVNHALRDALTEPSPVAGAFSFPTFGGGGSVVDHEPEAFSPTSDDEHPTPNR
jgi:hypothetical protein